MKKFLTLLLTFALALGALTGCGNKTEETAAETDRAKAERIQMPFTALWMRSKKAVPSKSAFSVTKILLVM